VQGDLGQAICMVKKKKKANRMGQKKKRTPQNEDTTENLKTKKHVASALRQCHSNPNVQFIFVSFWD
jgi:uncharacterized protein YoaH (UPF0181 family)